MKRFLIFICALFMCGVVNAATLNIKHNNITKQITLDTIQRTKPALAMRINNKTYYADLIETTVRNANNIYVAYNNKTYMVRDNKEYAFFITTTGATTSFDFKMSASGNFVVDWGDGTTQEIVRANTTETTYSHNYAAAGEYQIRLGGRATEYNTNYTTAAISFEGNKNITKINNSLGAVFPSIGGADTPSEQPRFYRTFADCSNLTGKIPDNLFDGVSGAPIKYMFTGTFLRCIGLTAIPETLFAGVSGAPAEWMFYYTFEGCTGLTEIPENLFAGIKGAPAANMFRSTFISCSGLKSIPEKLFAGISGEPAERMFYCTFQSCTNLTGNIPVGLFGKLYGAPAYEMFGGTFKGCTYLTGPTARTYDENDNLVRLYDIMYNGKTWLSQNSRAFLYMYDNSGIDINN